MTGISSTLKEEIKKTSDSKKKDKFKLMGCILCTNLLVAILCWSPNESKTSLPAQKIIHPGYQIMILPVEVFLNENSDELETAVTLISKDKKIIVKKAWLHERVKKESESILFKIEIPDRDVVRAGEFMEAGMIAVPFVEQAEVKRINRGSKYEIVL